jgi:hypothetical protein
MEDVMLSAKTSVDNAGIITAQLAEFTTKMNTGNGALSKLISDEKFSNSLQSTLVNLQQLPMSLLCLQPKLIAED